MITSHHHRFVEHGQSGRVGGRRIKGLLLLLLWLLLWLLVLLLLMMDGPDGLAVVVAVMEVIAAELVRSLHRLGVGGVVDDVGLDGQHFRAARFSVQLVARTAVTRELLSMENGLQKAVITCDNRGHLPDIDQRGTTTPRQYRRRPAGC